MSTKPLMARVIELTMGTIAAIVWLLIWRNVSDSLFLDQFLAVLSGIWGFCFFVMSRANTIYMSAFAFPWIGTGRWIEYIIRRFSYMHGSSCGLQLGLFIVGCVSYLMIPKGRNLRPYTIDVQISQKVL